ncbi:lysis system i-spanin subunit Rz [Pseudomonas shirazensis]|uniref:Lysozyme n=1 Tax=Pseudomonas putida TaxID=303 RepID=A0A2S3WB30_PSEPU|nr:lysozyme [Pseudomonas putida]
MSRGWLWLCLLLMLACAALAWQVQGWRYGRQLAEQAGSHAQQMRQQAETLAGQLLAERALQRDLQQRLQASESRYFQELTNAQQTQARLRDRLATADLRLSVLVERDSACATVPAAGAPGSVDHGAVRARLESAHARRIIAITDFGDRGLITLRACQDYVRELTR